MARQLRLLHRRRTRLRLSIEMIAVPLLGLLVLIQAESLRSPLSEREAPLAIAVRHPGQALVGQTSAAATVAASIGPKFLKNNEFGLRSFGVGVGCVALGVLVWLGARLFSVRTGVVAGIVLIATPVGRSFLGTQFGVEPFYLLSFLAALSATRNLAIDKRSLSRAAAAGGVAIALVGPSAVWIPIMTVSWLRKLRGLTWRSFNITVGTTLVTALAISLVAALTLGIAPLPIPAAFPSPLEAIGAFFLDSIQFLPFVPLALLGLWHLPRHWRHQGSPRFLLFWTMLAAGSLLVFGVFSPLWVACAMALGLSATWALRRAPRSHRFAAIGAAVVIGAAVGAFGPMSTQFDIDRWAVREAGKFLRRNISTDSAIAAPATARSRLAYYSSRPIAPLTPAFSDLDGVDYVFLDRRRFDPTSLAATSGDRLPRELTLEGHRLRIVAEFGSWIIARVAPAWRAETDWRASPRTL